MVQKKKQVQKKGKQPKRKAGPSGRSIDAMSRAYMKLVLDPCGGPLVHAPLTGTSNPGYLARNFTRLTFHLTAANSFGYLAWFPAYHTGGQTDAFLGGNLYAFEANDGSARPVNTVAAPFGIGVNPSATNGRFLADPSHAFVSSSTVASARTIAACARVLYTGTTVNTAGIVGIANNITASQLLLGGSGLPMSIDQVLTLCPNIQRTPVEHREARWMPDEQVSYVPANTSGANANACSPFLLGTAASSATSLTPISSNAKGFVIAWAGLNNTTANDYLVELYKVIEWLPDAIGFTQPTPVAAPQMSFADIARSIIQAVPDFYDSYRAMGGTVGQYTSLIDTVLGGNPLRMIRG